MFRSLQACALTAALLAPAAGAFGQPPPRLLPASVTGVGPAASAVRPVTGEQAPGGGGLGRLAELSPDARLAAVSARLGAEWLYRMNLPGGRFYGGVDSALGRYLEADSDFDQAKAALALCEAAAATADPALAARAAGAVLAILATTRLDGPARIPIEPADRLAVAAALSLAIAALPDADPTLQMQGDQLDRFLVSQIGADGVFTAHPGDRHEAAVAGPGLALQALLAGLNRHGDAATGAKIAAAVRHVRAGAKSRPAVAAGLVPVLVGLARRAGNEPAAVAAAFGLADGLCDGPSDAGSAQALAHAAGLTRRVPDAARFVKYRAAAVAGLTTARQAQIWRPGGSGGAVRLGLTADLVRADLAFLTTGAAIE